MSLDVTAYQGIRKLNVILDECREPIDPVTNQEIQPGNWFIVKINWDYSGRADDLEDEAVYSYKRRTGLKIDYDIYSQWRCQLADLSGYSASLKSSPFYNLINFSDCTGIIGTKVTQKLAGDFAEFDEKAKEMDKSFYSLYQQWKAAFNFAADNGCVEFW